MRRQYIRVSMCSVYAKIFFFKGPKNELFVAEFLHSSSLYGYTAYTVKKVFLFQLPIRKFHYQWLTILLLIPGHFSPPPIDLSHIPPCRKTLQVPERRPFAFPNAGKVPVPEWDILLYIPPSHKVWSLEGDPWPNNISCLGPFKRAQTENAVT